MRLLAGTEAEALQAAHEARRIAINVAKPPGLLRCISQRARCGRLLFAKVRVATSLIQAACEDGRGPYLGAAGDLCGSAGQAADRYQRREAAGAVEVYFAKGSLRPTKFEEKLNTDAPPKDGFINVYFAASDLPGRFAAIKCNCAYIGSAIIICDRRFLSSFGSVVNFTRDSFYGDNVDQIWEQQQKLFAQVNERISRVLFSWIVGHEIGHAVLHDNLNFERRRQVTAAEELEADAFFIDKALGNADQHQRQELSFGVTQFIFAIIGTAFRPAADMANMGGGTAVIAPSADDIHPPWLIRALRLAQLSWESWARPTDDRH